MLLLKYVWLALWWECSQLSMCCVPIVIPLGLPAALSAMMAPTTCSVRDGWDSAVSSEWCGTAGDPLAIASWHSVESALENVVNLVLLPSVNWMSVAEVEAVTDAIGSESFGAGSEESH